MKTRQQWNIELLKEQKEELLSEFDKTKDALILDDLYFIEQLLNDNVTFFNKPKIFSGKIAEDIAILTKNEEFLDEIKYLNSLKNILNVPKDIYLTELDYTNSILFSFIHDFYNQQPKPISSAFNKIFKYRKENVIFSDKRNSCIYLPYSRTPYINIQKNNTVEDFTNLIHEYGHAISDYINYHQNYNYAFIELTSMFYELIALDELYETLNLPEQDIRNSKIMEAKTILNYSNKITIFNEHLQSIDKLNSKKAFIRDMCKKYKKNKAFIKDIVESSNQEKLAYIIPYLVVIELYYLYQEDRELAIEKLIEIINLNIETDYMEILYDLDIFINTNSKKYIKSLNKK